MRSIKVKITLILAASLLGACAHKAPVHVVQAGPQGTAVLVSDAGQALIYRVEQQGLMQVFASARSLESVPDAGVRAVSQLDLGAQLQRTADRVVSQLRADGAQIEHAAGPLYALQNRYEQVLLLEIKRAGLAQARGAGDWPRAVYEISAQLIDPSSGLAIWRSNAEQVLDLPLADVVEGVPEAGAETLLRSSQQANADLLASILARMSQQQFATAF